MRILDLPSIIIVAAFVFAVAVAIACVILWKKRVKRRQAELEIAKAKAIAAHSVHIAWQKKIEAAGYQSPKYYIISQIEAPPVTLGDSDVYREGTFRTKIIDYENAKDIVKRATTVLDEYKLITDPVEQREELFSSDSFFRESLSPEDQQWVKDRILSISRDQVADLWAKAQAGDRDAFIELIAFTSDGRHDTYLSFTGKQYVEPEGWVELVSEQFEAPTLDTFRIGAIDDGALVLFAETANREQSVVEAKIVLAHWRIGQHYQLLIPQEMIVKLAELVEHHEAAKTDAKTAQA